MTKSKIWKQKKENIEDPGLYKNAGSIVRKILISRGITNEDEMEVFLNPSFEMLHDPYKMDGMKKGVQRIISAIDNCEMICVYGDYDVDGITAVSALYDFLESLGANVEFYIPDRISDGYGLSIDAGESIADRGVKLLISVDCGTTSVEETEYLKSRGIDVIITDHHECKEILPDAYALINPKLPGSNYPFPHLSGVGVVYKLIESLCVTLGIKGRERGYLDLTAIGTIADVVSMTGENRVLVRFGVEKINTNPNKGLAELIKASKISGRYIDEDVIGFVLAPRINAAGRLDDPSKAVCLFLDDDPKTAYETAQTLCVLNRERQNIQLQILKEAEMIIDNNEQYEKDDILVVAGHNWHNGVIGIVASVLCSKNSKAALVLTIDDNKIAKGSGRSIDGLNLFEALVYSSPLLLEYGGHEKAAGFTLYSDDIEALRKKMQEYHAEFCSDIRTDTIEYDMILNDEDISTQIVDSVYKMAPFGEGNPKPVFAYTGARITEIAVCGNDNQHLKVKISTDNALIDCIGFNIAKDNGALIFGSRVDVIGYLQVNEWKNRRNVQLQLIDIKEV